MNRLFQFPRILLLRVFLLFSMSLGVFGTGCGVSPEIQAQRDRIAQEPLGDYWVGRRFVLRGTRLWGYVRKPREHWEKSKLVLMQERIKTQPDRLPELNLYGDSFGFDHNHEYHLKGFFSGEDMYDPNSNLFVPEFVLTGYERVSSNPGFVLKPGDTENQKRLPFLPGQSPW